MTRVSYCAFESGNILERKVFDLLTEQICLAFHSDVRPAQTIEEIEMIGIAKATIRDCIANLDDEQLCLSLFFDSDFFWE